MKHLETQTKILCLLGSIILVPIVWVITHCLMIAFVHIGDIPNCKENLLQMNDLSNDSRQNKLPAMYDHIKEKRLRLE